MKVCDSDWTKATNVAIRPRKVRVRHEFGQLRTGSGKVNSGSWNNEAKDPVAGARQNLESNRGVSSVRALNKGSVW